MIRGPSRDANPSAHTPGCREDPLRIACGALRRSEGLPRDGLSLVCYACRSLLSCMLNMVAGGTSLSGALLLLFFEHDVCTLLAQEADLEIEIVPQRHLC